MECVDFSSPFIGDDDPMLSVQPLWGGYADAYLAADMDAMA